MRKLLVPTILALSPLILAMSLASCAHKRKLMKDCTDRGHGIFDCEELD